MDMTEVRKFDEAQVGKLKLSAYIRAGCSLGPQCQGSYWCQSEYCALGAAWAYAVGKHTSPTRSRIQKTFGVSKRLQEKIVTMNDEWGWTRERIADWLEAHGK